MTASERPEVAMNLPRTALGPAAAGGALALIVGACVELPPPMVDARPATDAGPAAGSGGQGRGGAGGQGGMGAGGDAGPPVCGPEQAAPCAQVVSIDAGDQHTCALLDDGSTRCWGANGRGELGRGIYGAFGHPGPGPSGLVELRVDGHHSCGLSADGVLRCWGSNSLGQLGREAPVRMAEPVQLLDNVTTFALANGTTCAAQEEGARCFGFVLDGQPPAGPDHGTWDASPRVVTGLEGETVLQLEGRDGTMCAQVADEVRCWGYNQAGRLGVGDEAPRQAATPIVPSYPTPVHQLSFGMQHGCLLAGSPTQIHCWGWLGPFHNPWNPTLLDVGFPDGPQVSPLAELASGWRSLCARYEDGGVYCVGDNVFGLMPELPLTQSNTDTAFRVTGLRPAIDLTMGRHHACALLDDGSVWCWGRNTEGQLGRGFLSASERPGPVEFGGRD